MADQLRILQVAPWPVHGKGTGGMAAVVRDLSAALRDAGHDAVILTSAWAAPKPDCDGAELRLRLPSPPSGRQALHRLKWSVHRERAARALLALCRRNAVDVIHAHYAAPYLDTLARARKLGAPPFLVTCHRGDVLAVPHLHHAQRVALTAAMHKASAGVAVSRWLAGEAETAFALDHVETVPNGFQPPWTELPTRCRLEERVGRRLPERYAVMVANMRPYKGHSVALRAWAMLDRKLNLPLVLVGSGPDFETNLSLARQFGLDDQVIFLGHVDRKIANGILAYSTIVLGPSLNEGQGLFALEAGFFARPLICSAIEPLTDIVIHDSTGLTVTPNDPAQLADAVLRLNNDPALQQRLGQNLQARIKGTFTLEAMANSYLSLYRQIIPPKSDFKKTMETVPGQPTV